MTSGCATVQVHFAVDAQVAVRADGERQWRAVPEDVTQLPPVLNAESPFSRVQYQHKAFVWNITIAESSNKFPRPKGRGIANGAANTNAAPQAAGNSTLRD